MTLFLLFLFLSTCSVILLRHFLITYVIDVISVCTMAEADIHSLLSKNQKTLQSLTGQKWKNLFCMKRYVSEST